MRSSGKGWWNKHSCFAGGAEVVGPLELLQIHQITLPGWYSWRPLWIGTSMAANPSFSSLIFISWSWRYCNVSSSLLNSKFARNGWGGWISPELLIFISHSGMSWSSGTMKGWEHGFRSGKVNKKLKSLFPLNSMCEGDGWALSQILSSLWKAAYSWCCGCIQSCVSCWFKRLFVWFGCKFDSSPVAGCGKNCWVCSICCTENCWFIEGSGCCCWWFTGCCTVFNRICRMPLWVVDWMAIRCICPVVDCPDVLCSADVWLSSVELWSSLDREEACTSVEWSGCWDCCWDIKMLAAEYAGLLPCWGREGAGSGWLHFWYCFLHMVDNRSNVLEIIRLVRGCVIEPLLNLGSNVLTPNLFHRQIPPQSLQPCNSRY